MRRYSFVFIMVLIAILIVGDIAQAAPKVVLNNNELKFDVPPVIQQNRVLVPLRGIFEALDAVVLWDQQTQTVTAYKDTIKIQLTIGGSAFKNDSPVNLDVPARIIQGRTMVPLRFVSEALGCQVDWDNDTQTVNIIESLKEIKYPNGDVFFGTLINGQREMSGRYTWVDGTMFQGLWRNDTMSGTGNLKYLPGHKYDGTFEANKKNGFGVYIWPNSDTYSGMWKNDKMEGQGIYVFKNGDKFDGNWANNMMNGYGTYTFSDGKVLRGTWLNNVYQK